MFGERATSKQHRSGSTPCITSEHIQRRASELHLPPFLPHSAWPCYGPHPAPLLCPGFLLGVLGDAILFLKFEIKDHYKNVIFYV